MHATAVPASPRRRQQTGAVLYLLAVAVLGAAFARYVIQDFHGPMLGDGDTSTHAFHGYYVLRYLHFVPWPRLDLHNDALLYPYGNDQVFQPWVFERDLFSALCLRLYGDGPWLQLHYLFSVLATAAGLFFLLRREHSQTRAAFAGLAVAFCNYYPIAKFPGHANLCVLHWSLLGVATDYLLARRVWRGETPSARLLLWRVALLFLALGLEMGYVAGLSLSSFALTAAWIVFLLWRRRHQPPFRSRPPWREALAAACDLRSHPWQTALLALTLAWGAFWYFPLDLQVFLHARKYPVGEILVGPWWQWANPLRLFIPLVPGLEPLGSPGNFERLVGFFHDEPEGFFAMSPGLGFVLLGGLGVVLAARRRTLGALAPVLILWLLVVADHPARFPVLRMFPWFAYVRTSAKLGDLNCLALVLLGVGGIPAGYFSPRPRWLPCGALALLLATEAITAYHLRLLGDRHYFVPGADFYRCMETIRRAPGDAVLEWPFCVASGNGIGTRELGAYYRRQSALYCLGEFHGKKVTSGYYGRLFPRQITPFLHAGWPALFSPDRPDPMEAARQTHDFDADQWSFFETFFRDNDFCGLLLSTDLLPAATLRAMHARFGPPAAMADAGPLGHLEFIPRPAAWGRPARPDAGKAVTFAVPLNLPTTHIDFTHNGPSADYLREGWSAIKSGPRYSVGPYARVAFQGVPGMPPASWTMDLFATTYGPQDFTVRFNGRPVAHWQCDGGPDRHFVANLPADAWRAGTNEITFDLPRAHHLRWKWDRASDYRPLGVRVESLDLRPSAALP